MTVGQHIMVFRKQKGVSQRELGKRIGTSEDIASLPSEEKKHVFKVLDAFLRDYKTQKAYSA